MSIQSGSHVLPGADTLRDVVPKFERQRTPARSRLKTEQIGYAQLSVIETALSPLDPSLLTEKFFETYYGYTDAVGLRQRASVKVGYAFEPLKRNDDFILWSLLSLTLRYGESNVLTATPYWLLKNIGMLTSGHQYQVLRDAVERLSQLLYHNTGFWNPITQRHERWQFAFFSSHLPTSLEGDRLWKFVWNEPFMEASRAVGGRLLFDLDLFRKLGSPATRRLYLKLCDRFHRSSRVHIDLHDLTINGLGYSPTVPLKVRKRKLLRCLETLLEHGIIELGRGHASVRDLIWKKDKGRYVVAFFRGPYFERSIKSANASVRITDDPLYEPMRVIGVDDPMIRRMLNSNSRGTIERWLQITEAAMKEKASGFPGFKVSPAAFFVDGVLNERMPPDWMYQLEKRQRQRQFEAEAAKMRAAEKILIGEYERERREALRSFIDTPAGKKLYEGAYEASLALWKARGEPEPVAERKAREDAETWTEQCDSFCFPELPVWTLGRRAAGN